MSTSFGNSDFSVRVSLTEEEFWPEMHRKVSSTWEKDLNLIKEFVDRHNIKQLCHFTLTRNLKSILDTGIQSRTILDSNSTTSTRMDVSSKLYFQDFNYVSISSPNTKMLSAKFKQGSWVSIILMDASLLRELPFFSIPMNSAKYQMPDLMREDYNRFLGFAGLQSLYANTELRKHCAIPASEPTDIQSELIFLSTIPVRYFKEIWLSPTNIKSPENLHVISELEPYGLSLGNTKRWKWLKREKIDSWDAKFSPEAQECFNLRNWNKDWGGYGK